MMCEVNKQTQNKQLRNKQTNLTIGRECKRDMMCVCEINKQINKQKVTPGREFGKDMICDVIKHINKTKG